MTSSRLDRRQLLSYAAFSSVAATAIGGNANDGSLIATTGNNANGQTPRATDRAGKKYSMKKSINLWAFPYPERMNLRECLELAKRAGFDGIELNYDLDSDLSPRATTSDFIKIRQMADQIGIAISGLCSFLF